MTLIEEQIEPIEIRRTKGMPRNQRPRCAARTRKGTPCKAQALLKKDGTPGRCKNHGGMSTGPRTEAGKESQREAASKNLKERWKRLKDHGIACVQISDEARERMAAASRRRMRMQHRKRQALEWADWIMKQLEQRASWPRGYNSHNVVIEPFRTAINHGGLHELLELASFTELKIERLAADTTDLYGIILDRYRYNARRLADEFRAGAER